MSLFILILVCSQLPGSVSIDPRLRWYTLESEHFAVHFPLSGPIAQESLVLPQRVANLAEEIHTTLAPVAGWHPTGRTDIVIASFYDYLNGWATPFPNNTITIIPTPEPGSRTNDDDWLRTLILHEYAHILQTDMAGGLPLILRRVFGRVALPNAIAPAWINEGYAIFCETRYSEFGRLRSADYDAMIRAAADNGTLLPIDRCGNYELRRYPAGNAPYLYGSRLFQYISEHDSLAARRFNLARARSFPFLDNYNARRSIGRTLSRYWRDWQIAAKAYSDSVRAAIGATTPSRRLTNEGFYTVAPCWSSGGGKVYYVSRNGREYPAIKAVDTADGSVEVLHRGLLNSSLSLSPDGRWLVFSERHRFQNYYEFDDLFWLDIATGRTRRLTHGQRARDPDFAPDTTLIALVATVGERTEVRLLDYRTGETHVLADGTDGAVYHRPRFSPSGKWLAVGVQRAGGYADIELIDYRSGWTIPITNDLANDLSPCWSRTGRFLFFASDRTGVYNLFAYELATGRLLQCTNSLYGYFEPAISPDNQRIAVIGRSAIGDDIELIELNTANWHEVTALEPSLPPVFRPESTVATTLYYYSPFPSLWPQFWLPLPFDGTGLTAELFTIGWDALRLHNYSFLGGWRFHDSTPHLNFGYSYSGLGPTLSMVVDAARKTQQASTGIGFSWYGTSHTNWLDLAASATRTRLLRARFDAEWTFSDALRYRFCVAPVQGRITGLHLDATARRLFGPNDLVRVLGTYVHYFGRPPQDWSLRTHLALGTAIGDSAVNRAWQLAHRAIIGVRGINQPMYGRTIVTTGLQLRKPLWWLERGISTAPLFLQNPNAAVFTDAGLIAGGSLPTRTELTNVVLSVGCELRLDVVLLHLVPASLSVGIAGQLLPSESFKLYGGIQSDILSNIFVGMNPNRNPLRYLTETAAPADLP